MTPEVLAAILNSLTLMANIRLEGMKAENVQREHGGHSPAYVMEHFDEVLDDLRDSTQKHVNRYNKLNKAHTP